jgi:hypothetical protein
LTTHPDQHSFQYLRGKNAIVARWRFVAVAMVDDKGPQVVDGHLDLLCAELKQRLNKDERRTTH